MRHIIPLFLIAFSAAAKAGYEAPAYIDGCRSMGGEFEITAEIVERGKTSHGPNKWNYVWKNLKTGEASTFPAQGLQGGQIYGQLFLAPDGETFALWNHVTMFWPEKSHMHASGHGDVVKDDTRKSDEFRNQFIFKNRLIIYKKDGTIVKTFDIADFLRDDEWETVLPVFNRTHWVQPYDNLDFKATLRTQYAFYRVSPDYTVLEFQAATSKANRKNPPRKVRVNLTDGTIFADDHEFTEEAKIPVRPFVGADRHPSNGVSWREDYVPSLDPVREAGTYTIRHIEEMFPPDKAPSKLPKLEIGEVRKHGSGYAKADTPSWLPKWGKKPEEAGRVLFTDLEAGVLHQFVPGADSEPTEFRAGATRGRFHPKTRKFYGLIDGKLAAWSPVGDHEPEFLTESEISLNDIVISSRGLIYFTTLKDPEKGRLSMVDPETKELTIIYDGEDAPELANPNGIALSKDERFLYVGVSNYKARKHSGVYAFTILGDGTVDFESGKAGPRFAVKAPDGIAVDGGGNVFFTAGNTIHIFTPYAQPLAKIKIPKGSGTNLFFPDERDAPLYFTTFNELYSVKIRR